MHIGEGGYINGKDFILSTICTLFVGQVIQGFWDLSIHIVSTLITMIVCYFSFNVIKNFIALKSKKYKWIKFFLNEKDDLNEI